MQQTAPDLTKQPPRSPRERLGGYVILARTTDKCRATLAGTNGEYHYNCPLDNMLFSFKGIDGEQFKAQVERDASDQELMRWLETAGTPRSQKELQEWSDQMERYTMMTDPEKRDFFVEECRKIGLDPAKTTLFEWLETDDKASFEKR